MKVIKNVNFALLTALFFGAILCSGVEPTQPQTHSFDTLFYASPYKIAFDGVMKLCGDLDRWYQFFVCDVCVVEDLIVISELLAQKLRNLDSNITGMLKNQKYIATEDLEYLVIMLEGLQRESAFISSEVPKYNKEQLSQLFIALKTTIEKRLTVQ